jgi:hypothetical protein
VCVDVSLSVSPGKGLMILPWEEKKVSGFAGVSKPTREKCAER